MAAKNSGQHQQLSNQQQQQQQQQQRQLPRRHLHTTPTATAAAFNGSKSLIDKDNLRDEDFDKLVINISNLVGGSSSKSRQRNQSCEERETVAEQCCSNSSLSDDRGADSSCSESPSRSELEQQPSLGQPKRPMNAFMVWGRAIRREIHLRFSNVQNALLSKALGRVWRSLDSAAKEPYVRKANQIKANHKRDYPDYRYQPRRLQEREKSKTTNSDEVSTSTEGQSWQRQHFAPDSRDACQSSTAAVFEPTIHPSIDGVHRRNGIRMELPVVGAGSRRINGLETSNHSMSSVVPSQYYVSNFACQDNNHIDSGFRSSIYCAADTVNGEGDGGVGGTPASVRLKAQYHDEYQQQQHRPLACSKQQPYSTANAAPVYSYPGSAYQHQFAYNMQFQQQPTQHQHQLRHTYHQQSHMHTSSGAMIQRPPLAGTSSFETTSSPRMSYVEDYSLSSATAVNTGGLDIGGSKRLLAAVPSPFETNGPSFARSYETRN